jgi:hypothetical protein
MNKKAFKYYYITDKNCFGDMRKFRYLTHEKALFELGSSEKAKSMLYDLQMLLTPQHLTSEQYEMNVGGIKPKHLYNAVKEKLNFYYKLSTKGEMSQYICDTNNQLTTILPSQQAFMNVIKGSAHLGPYLQEQLKSEVVSSFQPDLGLDAYLTLLYKEFVQDLERNIYEEIPLISWEAEQKAFKKFDPSYLQEGEYPDWLAFTERLDYPEIFCAWVWSLFEPEDFGRQSLWIHGEGFDGKSTVIRALTTVFGERHTCAISHRSYTEKWFFSEVYGKRLATYADCKNPRLISESRIHSLLGGDLVNIEYKGLHSFTAKIYSKLIIASNMAPEIDVNKASELTRLIYLEIKPLDSIKPDPLYEQRLIEQAPHFLHYCRSVYAKYCTNGVSIDLPKELTKNILKTCESKESSSVDDFIADALEFGENYKVSVNDLYSAMHIHLSANYLSSKINYAFTDLKVRFKRMGIEKKRVQQDGSRKTAYVGVRIKSEFKEFL